MRKKNFRKHKKVFFFSFDMYYITLFPDLNWAKILDPDPKIQCIWIHNTGLDCLIHYLNCLIFLPEVMAVCQMSLPQYRYIF